MKDWTNRADLVAAWMYDTDTRREMGLLYPKTFADLSLTLVARVQKDTKSFWEELCAVIELRCTSASTPPPATRPKSLLGTF
jgi:hypothetical protein